MPFQIPEFTKPLEQFPLDRRHGVLWVAGANSSRVSQDFHDAIVYSLTQE
jgi:hypothetical protein